MSADYCSLIFIQKHWCTIDNEYGAGKLHSLKLQEILLRPHPVKRTKRSRGVSVHSRIVDIACGSYASYAVDEAGKTWAWGLNNYGQIGLPGEVRSLT